ncbi:MAG: TSUP family transporter [Desulfobacterales bacterium]
MLTPKHIPLALVMLFFLAPTASFGAVADPTLAQFQEELSQSVATVRPSVVSITAQKKKPFADAQATGITWYESVGAGFIIDKRGFILTNFHVVEDAKKITVHLWGAPPNEYTARLVHAEASLDLAVIRIEGRGPFPVAGLADSDRIKTGDWVISVGSPFGFEHSASLGIVSDLHRDLTIGGTVYKDMIQTDAVINQGNSGGPLIDIYGRVVGVGTAIYAPDGTYRGIGFAIPINRAKHFFSRVTGATRVALTRPVARTGNKTAVDLGKPMPVDAIHKTFADCTGCHTIAAKRVSSLKATVPHPMISGCNRCHTMVNDPIARGPVTVAHNVMLAAQPEMAGRSPGSITTIILKLTMITLIVSIVFSMMGVGGGFLYVPILLSCGIDFHTAATTSLVMLSAAQVSALYIFFKSELVDLKLAMVLELPTMIGAFTGGMLSEHFNVGLLVVLFAGMLFLASYAMMQDQTRMATLGGPSLKFSPFEWHHEFRGHAYGIDMALVVPLTFVVGFLGGLMGLAGGWLKIPMMVLLFNIPMKIAVATSSLMVTFTGISGFLGHSVAGHFEPRLAIALSVLTVIGAQIGARLSIKTESNLLRFIFAFVLSTVGLWMLVIAI